MLVSKISYCSLKCRQKVIAPLDLTTPAQATSAYKKFSLAMDDLDYLCRAKDLDLASAQYTAVIDSLNAYKALVL